MLLKNILFHPKLNKKVNRIIFYFISIIIAILVTLYSQKHRMGIKENSEILVSINHKREKVTILNKFTSNDKILANQCIKLVSLILNTNFNDFNYNNFYWMESKSSTGNTIFYDIKPQKERADILIDYRVYPQKNAFYSQNLIEFGSHVLHELFHYYYLSSEDEIGVWEYQLIQKTIELKYETYECKKCKKQPNHCDIKNQLDLLVQQVGL